MIISPFFEAMKVASFLFLALFFLGSCSREKQPVLTIACAANVQFAMEELAQEFSRQTGITTQRVYGSSGKLTAQIQQEAPFDLFVSANMKYPMELVKGNFTLGDPEIYAYGKLVLWSLTWDKIPEISEIPIGRFQKIALANPELAPYGKAALEAMKYYGVYEKAKGKLVYGESISQTNQFIISKSCDFGFTAKSVVLSPKMKKKGLWREVKTESYAPIEQGAVIIDKKNNKKEAKEFYDFLFSNGAREILTKYGYQIP